MPREGISGENPFSPPEPWASFLEALDSRLDEAVDLHCIGGFAMTLQYGLSRTTSDIDILAAIPNQKLKQLQELAGLSTDLHRRFKVYLQPVAIASYPEDYESRLVRMWPKFELEHLRVYSLEAHDLALTKLERNADVDRQDVQGLARTGYLDPSILRARYIKEFRPNLISGAEKHDLTLDLWLEMCWPATRS